MSKNVTAVGFHEDGKWMFTGGEDCSARIWDLRYCMSLSDLTFIMICTTGTITFQEDSVSNDLAASKLSRIETVSYPFLLYGLLRERAR